MGVIALLAWPVSAAAGRAFGLAVVPGTTGVLSALSGRPFPLWDVVLVLGILAGGWLGGRKAGTSVLKAPVPAELLKRFAGGVGLGVGASLAAGCTVGQGVTGLALLAPGSATVMAAIFAGSTLATLMSRSLPFAAGAIPSSNPR
jgi:hypothetical protein